MPLKLTAGYHMDFGQIARIAAFCAQADAQVLTGHAIAEKLGISSARLHRLWMIATALGVGERGTWKTTELGRTLIQHDRFLDDVGTLWLLHYIISSDPGNTVWNTMVNHVLVENPLVTMTVAKGYFASLMERYTEASFNEHLNKEINAFFDAYTRQSFSHLDYLVEETPKTYSLKRGAAPPSRVFEAALLLFRDRFLPHAVTMDIVSIASRDNSPGRVFGLTGRQVQDLLEEVEGPGGIYVESRADLDQVRFPDDLTFLDAVRRYYEER
jgi:hypothetical protein